jgi:hypothetical protein
MVVESAGRDLEEDEDLADVRRRYDAAVSLAQRMNVAAARGV